MARCDRSILWRTRTPSQYVDDKGVPSGEVPSTISSGDLYDRVAHNTFSINFVWTLVTGFLVMFMQAGFAMVEGGLCRSKNSAHTFTMNFMIYPLGCLAFYVYGFALVGVIGPMLLQRQTGLPPSSRYGCLEQRHQCRCRW